MKKIICLIACLMFTASSQAVLVTYNGYTLNSDTNIVTGGGLEWLQWDVTRGMTIEGALVDIADGVINGTTYGTGWVLASNVNMAALFNTFGFGAAVGFWDADELITQFSINNDGLTEDITSDPEKQFVTIFGNTFLEYGGNAGSVDPLEHSAAFFGSDLNNDNVFNLAEVIDDYIFETSPNTNNGRAVINSDSDNRYTVRAIFGVALVRQVPAPTSVNEPSTLAVMSLALLGLVRLRRRH